MRKMMMAALCASAMAASAHATVREEPVTYQDGETTMKGFVVFDEAIQGKRPGIIMVHEWWGITKHVHRSSLSRAIPPSSPTCTATPRPPATRRMRAHYR